jgi:hypothetical protein
VRLSVIVSVSAIAACGASLLRVAFRAVGVRPLGGRVWLGGNPIVAPKPAPEVHVLAALAAERHPRRFHRSLAAIRAQRTTSHSVMIPS